MNEYTETEAARRTLTSVPERPDDPWPNGGNQRGRPSVTFHTNKHGTERIQINLDYEQGLAVAVGEAEATAQLLYYIRQAVQKSEDGTWRAPKHLQKPR
jgi:hypothetical protein